MITNYIDLYGKMEIAFNKALAKVKKEKD